MQTQRTTNERTLRGWLTGRSTSERGTIARLWALSELVDNAALDADTLADAMLQPVAVARVLAALSEREQAALERLLAEQGVWMLAPVLEREFGTIRTSEQYPNPRAYLLALQQPPSPTERLFTLGLLLQHDLNRQQIYAVPQDLLPFLPEVPLRDQQLHLTPIAEPPQVVEGQASNFEYLLATLLGLAQAHEISVIPTGGMTKASMVRLAKRWGQKRNDLQGLTHERHWPYIRFLRLVAEGAGLLRVTAENELQPTPAALEWLGQPPVERTRCLLEGWVQSRWDELTDFVGIQFKRYAFGRDVPAARRAVLDMLREAQPGAWVAFDTLLAEVQRANPDFVRPDGHYDRWGLANYRGEDLDGFEHWNDVEGELLRTIVSGSVHWLGLIDFGGREAEDKETLDPIGFRLNALGAAVLGLAPPPALPAPEPLVVQGTFEVLVPRGASLRARFDVGCFAEYHSGEDMVERYLLSKASVHAAVEGGVASEQLVAALEHHSGAQLPPNVRYSLQEWAGQYGALTLSSGALLRAADPLLLERLKRDRRVKLPVYEQLNPETWLLAEGDAVALESQLRRAGYGLAGEAATGQRPLKESDLTVMAAALEFYANACDELGMQGDASNALRQRVVRLLNQKQRERVVRLQHEALSVLKQKLNNK